MSKPAVTDGGLEHLPNGYNLIVERTSRRRFTSPGSRDAMHPVLLHSASSDVSESKFAKEREEMKAKTNFVALNPPWAIIEGRDAG